ncbi:MAG: glycosyltransferase family 2 protein [Verrucomicrobia bacterium]|nr:glycosyltransferase family 2 protein [Verrucomicrobiota bacterium]
MLISLILPVYNESENIAHLWERLKETIAGMNEYRFEAVFVDDGSYDSTVEEIQKLQPTDALSWKLVRFSRNFGHQAAISAGMRHAEGEAHILLDADLQDPPEMIPVFLEKFREGYDVVYGIRQNRKEPWWLRFCFKTFYRLINAIADRPIPLDVGDFGLISKRVAGLISEMPENDRLIRGMRSWVGFKQLGIPYDRPARYAGTPSYNLRRLIELGLDGIFGFSKAPIRVALFTGMLVCAIGGIYLLQVLISFAMGGRTVQGWTSLITLGFMLGGANLIAIAIVGEYVCRIYFQTKNRPLYVVERIEESPSSKKAIDPAA